MNKAALTRILCLCVFSVSLNAQYTVFSKGSKYGIKSGNEILIKAKYNQVLIGDTSIFALERKGKWEYRDAEGKTIYAAKDSRFLTFYYGYGIVCDVGLVGYCYTIDANGKELGRFYESGKPERFADKLIFPESKKIYTIRGGLLFKYDSISSLNPYLFCISGTEVVSGSKKVFGIKIKKTTEAQVTYLMLKKTGLMYDGISNLEVLANGDVLAKRDGEENGLMLNAEGKVLISGIISCEQIRDNGLYAIKTKSGMGLWSAGKQMWLVVPEGMKSVTVQGSFIWVGAADSTYSIITDGIETISKTEGVYKKVLDKTHVVTESSKGLLICTPDGKSIGEYYDAILGDANDGKLIVQKDRKFAYIHAETGNRIGEYHDLYYAIGSSAFSDRSRRFMTIFVAVFAAPALPLVAKSLDKNKNKRYIYTVNEPAPYKDGYVVLGIADKEKIKLQGDSLFLEGGDFSLDYVYLNSEGKAVSPTYDEAMDFNNGWAWVKGSKGFYRINTSFQALDKNYYDEVRSEWGGEYHVVRKSPFNTGLMDKNGLLIAPTKYDWITVEKDQIVGMKGGDATVLISK